MFAQVNGIELFYERAGEGRPLLMVHGNGEDHTIFDRAVGLLKKKYTCYAVDSRCHGRSSAFAELHYEDMARDMIAFMEALDLEDVIFYGFSDGGIVGLLAAAECPRITTIITSGANLTPEGVKGSLKLLIKVMNGLKPDPKLALMLNEPHISDDTLGRIRARTLVLAGSKDLVKESETRHIAAAIPGARLHILDGEGHGSYIVHKEKIARLIMDFAM